MHKNAGAKNGGHHFAENMGALQGIPIEGNRKISRFA
jgi:hypothetical protein